MPTTAIRIAQSYFAAGLLLLGVTACSESSDAGPTASTAAPGETTAVTAAPSSTATSTTELSTTTTTAPPTVIVATGTWAGIPEMSFSPVPLPSGYTWEGVALAFDGDLVGTTLYDLGVSPVGESGLVTLYSDGTFRGTLVGVGEGTLAWSEPEIDVTLPPAPGSAPLVGVSGDFLGATGTFSWTYTDDSHGTYEVRLTWD